MGFVMTLSNFGFMAAVLAFFIAGSKVTKWRSSFKRKIEADFKEGCCGVSKYLLFSANSSYHQEC